LRKAHGAEPCSEGNTKLINRVFDRAIDALAFLAAVIVVFIMLVVSADRAVSRLPPSLSWGKDIPQFLRPP
jgi:hypothetical protein